jgi:hypothetical protein
VPVHSRFRVFASQRPISKWTFFIVPREGATSVRSPFGS